MKNCSRQKLRRKLKTVEMSEDDNAKYPNLWNTMKVDKIKKSEW